MTHISSGRRGERGAVASCGQRGVAQVRKAIPRWCPEGAGDGRWAAAMGQRLGRVRFGGGSAAIAGAVQGPELPLPADGAVSARSWACRRPRARRVRPKPRLGGLAGELAAVRFAHTATAGLAVQEHAMTVAGRPAVVPVVFSASRRDAAHRDAALLFRRGERQSCAFACALFLMSTIMRKIDTVAADRHAVLLCTCHLSSLPPRIWVASTCRVPG